MYGGELIRHTHPGKTPQHLANEIAKMETFYRAHDVVVCVCYLKGATTADGRYEGDPLHLQGMMNELFRSLKTYSKRCFRYLGGTASYFQLPPQ